MSKRSDAGSNTLPKMLARLALCALIVYSLPAVILATLHFPFAVDPESQPGLPAADRQVAGADTFYRESYDTSAADIYVETARKSTELSDITGRVRAFALEFGLENKRVLEVGAGSGALQDIVKDYTGLDIAASARRFFHKPFVQASATAMPFKENEFVAVWSIWVLEHVSQPELALREMRRVVKDRGLVYLAPAWNCVPWAAEGYEVRPYSDFGLIGRLTKASTLVRGHPLYRYSYLVPIRLARLSWWSVTEQPMALRYHRLNPNYEKYWVADSDAVNSIDSFEAYLWFKSRGDACMNCATRGQELLKYSRWPLVIRLKKPQSGER